MISTKDEYSLAARLSCKKGILKMPVAVDSQATGYCKEGDPFILFLPAGIACSLNPCIKFCRPG
jgi:hypothetical protein